MRTMNLHHLETSGLGAAGSLAEIFHQLVNFI